MNDICARCGWVVDYSCGCEQGPAFPLIQRIEKTPTYTATIFIAGDHAKALRLCQAHCDEVGLCVTVEPTTYVYTGGAEAGVRVGLINYPRFPSCARDIFRRAKMIGMILLDGLEQQSFSIVATDGTIWFSRRVADIAP